MSIYKIHCGDCLTVVPHCTPNDSVDLIFTSPPYADQRKKNYRSIHPDKYVEWFLPRSQVFMDALSPTGSFVLNIKEQVVKGERHPYVLHLILALRKQGWQLVDEYIWCKKNSYPGKWPNRFRDSWERLLHFTKSPRFKMNQETVMVPIGDWSKTRLKNVSKTDIKRDPSGSKNAFAKRVANWTDRKMVYPTNVLHMATECHQKGHPATFPVDLPEWFVRLFSDPGDLVVDPFAGSGTTLVAAVQLGRQTIGIDTEHEFCTLMENRIEKVRSHKQSDLFPGCGAP